MSPIRVNAAITSPDFGHHACSPRFLNTTRFSQQEVFEDKVAVASGKRSSAGQALQFFNRRLWPSLDFDEVVERLAVRANKGIVRRWPAAPHD
jgi:hypothetical protein